MEKVEKSRCLYTPCYCEENIYHLCKKLLSIGSDDEAEISVVFISNRTRSIPLWRQKLGRRASGGLVTWDYHVILLVQIKAECLVYDFDTTLPFPCSFSDYCEQSIGSDDELPARFRRKFRLIAASRYLELFSSDRSHMRDGAGGWLAEPPNWPVICSSTNNWLGTSSPNSNPLANTLPYFWNMESESNGTTVLLPDVDWFVEELRQCSSVIDTNGFATRFLQNSRE